MLSSNGCALHQPRRGRSRQEAAGWERTRDAVHGRVDEALAHDGNVVRGFVSLLLLVVGVLALRDLDRGVDRQLRGDQSEDSATGAEHTHQQEVRGASRLRQLRGSGCWPSGGARAPCRDGGHQARWQPPLLDVVGHKGRGKFRLLGAGGVAHGAEDNLERAVDARGLCEVLEGRELRLKCHGSSSLDF